jgi:hypothetical protein
MDRGLILEHPRGLSAKSAKSGPRVDFTKVQGPLCKISERIIFQWLIPCTGSMSPWTGRVCSVHRGPTPAQTEGTTARSLELGLRPLRCAKAHRRGRKTERGATGTRLGSHRSSGGAVEAGRRWCRTGRQRRSVRGRLERGEK